MHKKIAFLLSSAVIAGILVTVLFVVAGPGAFASAAPGPDVVLAAERRVCPTCPYTTIQAAVDAADPGDTIKVAQGVYTGVQNVPSLNTATFTATQIVVITKSLALQGGYTTTDWTTPDPAAHPTILNAGGQGRVLVITGTITPPLRACVSPAAMRPGWAALPGATMQAAASMSTLPRRSSVVILSTATPPGAVIALAAGCV